MLFGWQESWAVNGQVAQAIVFVTAAQMLCGVAKDLTKLGGKTVTKLVTPDEKQVCVLQGVGLLGGAAMTNHHWRQTCTSRSISSILMGSTAPGWPPCDVGCVGLRAAAPYCACCCTPDTNLLFDHSPLARSAFEDVCGDTHPHAAWQLHSPAVPQSLALIPCLLPACLLLPAIEPAVQGGVLHHRIQKQHEGCRLLHWGRITHGALLLCAGHHDGAYPGSNAVGHYRPQQPVGKVRLPQLVSVAQCGPACQYGWVATPAAGCCRLGYCFSQPGSIHPWPLLAPHAASVFIGQQHSCLVWLNEAGGIASATPNRCNSFLCCRARKENITLSTLFKQRYNVNVLSAARFFLFGR